MLGKVLLVGAGPGDPDLLTVKAMRAIAAADVVVYDRLVPADVLSLIPAGAARVDVGKQAGFHPIPQEEINALLIKLAREGRTVVRLKVDISAGLLTTTEASPLAEAAPAMARPWALTLFSFSWNAAAWT